MANIPKSHGILKKTLDCQIYYISMGFKGMIPKAFLHVMILSNLNYFLIFHLLEFKRSNYAHKNFFYSNVEF